ncbi:adaptor protein MecA [Youxingia wuxianensis]|uniref:Adaptor protein MecA n=1 Tax=Youxingia wuxianensis TaxID=2763678 RepID=A0A926IGQ6_9FIRM|nr:adaptor protein MecA [Youxingia wuxianensis]MBC8584506.1 adaptor protein MecA [Youxingia wuxianensis]
MDIRMLGPDRIQIILSKEDMRLMDITYETIDYTNEETKKLILELLDIVQMATDFQPNKSKLFVEVYPTGEGGCSIYFSAVEIAEKKRYRIKKNVTGPLIYRFLDIDALISASVRLFKLYCHRVLKSSLYQLKSSWQLVIYPLDSIENVTARFMDEYAERWGEGELAAAYVEEHGTLIIKENAIDLLAAYFG